MGDWRLRGRHRSAGPWRKSVDSRLGGSGAPGQGRMQQDLQEGAPSRGCSSQDPGGRETALGGRCCGKGR